MMTKTNYKRLIQCCTALEYLDDAIRKAFSGSIGQSEFEDVFLVYDVLQSESHLKDSKEGLDPIISILRDTSLSTEEKYQLLR